MEGVSKIEERFQSVLSHEAAAALEGALAQANAAIAAAHIQADATISAAHVQGYWTFGAAFLALVGGGIAYLAAIRQVRLSEDMHKARVEAVRAKLIFATNELLDWFVPLRDAMGRCASGKLDVHSRNNLFSIPDLPNDMSISSWENHYLLGTEIVVVLEIIRNGHAQLKKIESDMRAKMERSSNPCLILGNIDEALAKDIYHALGNLMRVSQSLSILIKQQQDKDKKAAEFRSGIERPFL